MKRNKLNITHVGDMNAAMTTWNEILSKGPELMRNPDFDHYGGIVFAHAHLLASRQTIGLIFFDEKNLRDVNVASMADTLRDRHAGIFNINSLEEGLFDFEIYLVFNEEQTAVENIICVDFTIRMICFLEDGSKLEPVLKKFMRLDTPFPTVQNYSAN